MKTYYLDTNIILRFILKDKSTLYKQSFEYFQQAKEGIINLIIIPEIIFEVVYVLKSVYKFSKKEIIDVINPIIKSTYLDVNNRDLLLNAFSLYEVTNLDIVDLYIYVYAERDKVEILTFDKALSKLDQLRSNL